MPAKKKTTTKVKTTVKTTKTTRTAKTTKAAKKKKPEGEKLAMLCASAALDIKAEDLVILDMRGISSVTDYFVICTGVGSRQVAAIAERVIEKIREAGVRPLGEEGLPEGRWVLVDAGDVVIHVFDEETRKFYNLEKLWMDAPLIEPPK